jgi:hypothetical protein
LGVPEKSKRREVSYREIPRILASALAGLSNIKKLWENSKQPGTDVIIGE